MDNKKKLKITLLSTVIICIAFITFGIVFQINQAQKMERNQLSISDNVTETSSYMESDEVEENE